MQLDVTKRQRDEIVEISGKINALALRLRHIHHEDDAPEGHPLLEATNRLNAGLQRVDAFLRSSQG